jgi:hypothetical protein
MAENLKVRGKNMVMVAGKARTLEAKIMAMTPDISTFIGR